MRKSILATLALAAVATAPAAAQSGFVVGLNAGVAVPMGDAGDVLETGFGGGATIMMRSPDSKVGFGIEASFNRFSYSEDALLEAFDARLNMYGALARIEFAASNNLYVVGGAGLYRTELTGDDDFPDLGETTNTDFVIQGGLGLNFGPGLFAEAKYVNIFSDPSNTQFVPITVGIRF